MAGEQLYCFFDTNFISKVERSISIEILDKHILDSVGKRIITNEPFFIVMNPISLLEYSGQKLIALTSIPRRLRKPGQTSYLVWIEKLFSWLYERAKKQTDEITPKIIAEISKKKNEATPNSLRRKFFGTAENLLFQNTENTFSHDLALLGIGSIIGGIELHNENERRAYHKIALQFLFGRIAEGHLSTIGKISSKVALELYKSGKVLEKDVNNLPSQELLEQWGWDSDLADDMLITISLFGTPTENGHNIDVDCFTCDDHDELLARLNAAILICYFISSLEDDRINAGKESQYKVPRLCPENIHIYDKESKIFRVLKVEQIIRMQFPEWNQ